MFEEKRNNNEFDEENVDNQRNFEKIKKQFLWDISDPFNNMKEESFRKLYRMPPHTAIVLIERLRPYLRDHERGVPPHLQVLSVIRFLAEGSYQKGVSQDLNHPMGQSTFSRYLRYLHEVIPAINTLADEFIKFPSTREEREVIERGYANYFNTKKFF